MRFHGRRFILWSSGLSHSIARKVDMNPHDRVSMLLRNADTHLFIYLVPKPRTLQLKGHHGVYECTKHLPEKT